jgi:hypothetical protein
VGDPSVVNTRGVAVRSPTSHTLNFFRKQGDMAEVTEKWIPVPKHPGGGIRRDLFECIDVMVIQGAKLLGIQSTSGSNHSARVAKALASDRLAKYIATGNGFEVWSWAKRGPRGKRKVWTPKVTQLVMNGDNKVVVA